MEQQNILFWQESGKRSPGEYFNPPEEDIIRMQFKICRVRTVFGNRGPEAPTDDDRIIARDMLNIAYQYSPLLPILVMEEKTHGIRHAMKLAAMTITVPAVLMRFIAPFILLEFTARHLPAVLTGALNGVAMGLNWYTYSQQSWKIRRYYDRPMPLVGDVNTIELAYAAERKDVLLERLGTTFVCERDNVWYRSVAIAGQNAKWFVKYWMALREGLRIGLKHNASIALAGNNDKINEITFRLTDGAYQDSLPDLEKPLKPDYFASGWHASLPVRGLG